jgi:hypothetical protein
MRDSKGMKLRRRQKLYFDNHLQRMPEVSAYFSYPPVPLCQKGKPVKAKFGFNTILASRNEGVLSSLFKREARGDLRLSHTTSNRNILMATIIIP